MSARNELYLHHAAPNTVPEGNLLSDLSPRRVLRAAQIVLAKSSLSRKRLPIRLNLDEYRSPDFRYDTGSAEKVQKMLEDVPLTDEGMRWIHEDDGVLFYGTRTLDLPYDEFVDRVDISRVGDCFRDVLGINTRVLHRDEAGRPLLQVERIAALAQPNYTAFMGKDELDVYKLEWMQYGPDEVRNWMRTVCSPNASTSADDGYLAFSRTAGGAGTRIVFVARQAFPRPRLLVLSGLDRWGWFRTLLTENAYRRFWNDTVANILARHEGKEIGIGRPGRDEQSGRRRALGVTAVGLACATYLRRRAKRRG
ncbi:hypothetical protein [Allokutzneria albata]|uniref:Uncharacterized protein n=1 Tax=Allokutzneria albata TaxID=211114 RepID=A0A1G9S6B6_ALLAB|nr:hypothetical protein [Allokutzneria albata]SDM30954.1 hypothetical protein SAMN04489726_0916 [Allokutzneria albata]